MSVEGQPGGRESSGKTMLAGAAWAIAMRWCMRLLGIVSVTILARMLTPADFGIVAMAALVIALVDSLSEFGTDLVLLRQAQVTREDCDTAWTFRLLQGVATAVIILAAAPLAASYFNEPRLPLVMAVLALSAVIGSASNIGMTLVRKELKFAVDFRFGLYKKLVEFCATVALAYWLRSYWALVIGSLVGAIAAVVISYLMHDYRPRLSLKKYKEYLSFSFDAVASNLARLMKNKVDVFILGGSAGAAATGSYNVSAELARMGTQEIVIPAWRGLFPAFSAMRHDPPRFNAAYVKFVGVIATLCLPMGIGLWGMASEVVLLLLGSQWTSAIEPLKWLAIGAAFLALVDTFGGSILFVSGHERRAVYLIWGHLALLIPALVVANHLGGVVGVAITSAGVAAVMVPIAALVVTRSIGLSLKELARVVWRPVAATLVMAAALYLMQKAGPDALFLRFLSKAAVGAGVYMTTLALLWWLDGQPDGIEKTVLGRLFGRWVRPAGT